MDTSLVQRPAYVSPQLIGGVDLVTEEEPWVWAVVVGLSFAVALVWATYCRRTGGNADISFGWSGFKVKCTGR